MKDYRITFWTPGHRPEAEDVFGCASLGAFAGGRWLEPDSAETVTWRTVRGTAIAGSYGRMLEDAAKAGAKPGYILCFLTGGTGNDGFVDGLQRLFPGVPILGGTAARSPDQTAGEVLPAGQDGAILLAEGAVAATGCRRVHRREAARVTCEIMNGREIRAIEGRPALEYLNEARAKLGRAETDFESITFHEPCGKNVHCSRLEEDALYAGADIQEQPLILAETTRQEASGEMKTYLRAENALAIGCAGLKSLLDGTVEGLPGNVGVFLFGEVVPFEDGRSRFCNLMLGRLVPADGQGEARHGAV